MPRAPVVGIALGSAHLCVAEHQDQENGKTVFGVMRLLGRNWDDPELQSAIRYWPFHLPNDDNDPKVSVTHNGRTEELFPEEIIATKDERNVVVFSLGAGACSVPVITIEFDIVEVKSSAGDNHLGGFEIDNDSLQDNNGFFSSISRVRLEELNADLFQKALNLVERALKDAKMDRSEVHDIVLVGGSTRIPKIQELLQEFFHGKPLNHSLNPEEAPAYGAGILSAILCGKKTPACLQDILLRDTVPFSLGIETNSGEVETIIRKHTTIPTKMTPPPQQVALQCGDDGTKGLRG
ncbi:heat shock cognate 71 kDa protein-like [Paramacrobiotus metropolitanus]|uniref:heat shock cognate 71 kDa protein-like n=1 Tax=Paramacrobiotus metropolitanus TaxID=2943436 RepID=UPI0024463F9C|nr:heat shock cognate 71 kDa protein-like [Paramacrobiotus metropolitanus]